ncbi:MAG: hypothetical protein IH602_17005 [Bryobacteraceae bacterium]|nr:hypothetical protein [Bryobacteraceae bacterium]
MKIASMISLGLVLGCGSLLLGQDAQSGAADNRGRGRGGAPFAWNDKDKDGVCDITGQPAGQGRGQGMMRGARRGRGASTAGGFGAGRGMRFRQQRAAPASPRQ